MRKLGFIARKGGSGKTTLCLNVACALVAAGQTAVVLDLDDQGSCIAWDDARAQDAPVVVPATAGAVPRLLAGAAARQVDWVLCDTPAVVDAPAHAVAEQVDLVLIPAQPTLIDLAAIVHTLKLCRLAEAPACVVLNRCDGRTRERQAAARQLATVPHLTLCPVAIGSRAAFRHAYAAHASVLEGPDAAARTEIERFVQWIRETVP